MRQAEHAYTTLPEQAAERQRLRVLRTEIEFALEEMITLLDALDGDPDLEDTDGGDDQADLEPDEDGEEDDGAEPSLGATDATDQTRWAWSGQHDLEEENEHGGDINDEPQLDDGDLEPSLASPENPEGDQTGWAVGDASDREADHSIEEAPAVLEAARVRAYAERERTEAAGREAERQLAELRGYAFRPGLQRPGCDRRP